MVIAKNRLTGGWQGLYAHASTARRRSGSPVCRSSRRGRRRALSRCRRSPREQAKAELGAFLDRLAEAEAFSGTALLAKDGQVVFEAARGVADRNHGVPMRLESKLNRARWTRCSRRS